MWRMERPRRVISQPFARTDIASNLARIIRSCVTTCRRLVDFYYFYIRSRAPATCDWLARLSLSVVVTLL